MRKAKFQVGDIVYIDNNIKETLFNRKLRFKTAEEAQKFANMDYDPINHKLLNGVIKEIHPWKEIYDKFFYIVHGIYMFQPELGSFDFYHVERYMSKKYSFETTKVLPVTHYSDFIFSK